MNCEQQAMLQEEVRTFSQQFASQSEVREVRDQQANQSEQFRAELEKHRRSILGQLEELDKKSLPRTEAEEIQHRQEEQLDDIRQQRKDYRLTPVNQITQRSTAVGGLRAR